MNDKEKRIKEQRIIEATRKGYSGGVGRFGTIAKNLGQRIVLHGGGSTDITELPDFYGFSDHKSNENWNGNPRAYQDTIPYMGSPLDNEEPIEGGWRDSRDIEIDYPSIADIGWYFDGLSSGMHLEIKYELESAEIIVRYQGNLVYKEVAGELEVFVPNEEWESKISMLFDTARERERKSIIQEKQERTDIMKSEKAGWLNQMKKRWGL